MPRRMPRVGDEYYRRMVRILKPNSRQFFLRYSVELPQRRNGRQLIRGKTQRLQRGRFVTYLALFEPRTSGHERTSNAGLFAFASHIEVKFVFPRFDFAVQIGVLDVRRVPH